MSALEAIMRLGAYVALWLATIALHALAVAWIAGKLSAWQERRSRTNRKSISAYTFPFAAFRGDIPPRPDFPPPFDDTYLWMGSLGGERMAEPVGEFTIDLETVTGHCPICDQFGKVVKHVGLCPACVETVYKGRLLEVLRMNTQPDHES